MAAVAVAVLLLVGALYSLDSLSNRLPFGRPELQYLPANAQRLDWQLQPGNELWAPAWVLEYGEMRGPLYGVYQGQVVSVSYQFTEEVMQKLLWFRDDRENPAVRVEVPVYMWIGPLNMPVDHMDIAYTPVPRPGFPGFHWEATAWRIPPEEKAAIARGERPVPTLREFPPAPSAVPSDATAYSDPVPELGQHFWRPADFPFGPFWAATCGEGARYEVAGLVYMYSQREMTRTAQGGWEFNNIPVHLAPDHFHLLTIGEGFHGFDTAHWDLRIQFTPHESHFEDPRFLAFSFDPCLATLPLRGVAPP